MSALCASALNAVFVIMLSSILIMSDHNKKDISLKFLSEKCPCRYKYLIGFAQL